VADLHDAGSTRTRRTGPTWKQFWTAQALGILRPISSCRHVLLRASRADVIEHGTRRVRLAGITAQTRRRLDTQAAASPDGPGCAWPQSSFDQGARASSRLLRRRVHRARHQDSHSHRRHPGRTPLRKDIAPSAGSSSGWIVSEHMRQVLTEYLQHSYTGRPHRALGQLAPAQADTRPPSRSTSRVRIAENSLGGLIHEYRSRMTGPRCSRTRQATTPTCIRARQGRTPPLSTLR